MQHIAEHLVEALLVRVLLGSIGLRLAGVSQNSANVWKFSDDDKAALVRVPEPHGNDVLGT